MDPRTQVVRSPYRTCVDDTLTGASKKRVIAVAVAVDGEMSTDACIYQTDDGDHMRQGAVRRNRGSERQVLEGQGRVAETRRE